MPYRLTMIGVIVCLAIVGFAPSPSAASSAARGPSNSIGLHLQGAHLVNGDGLSVTLHGVNRSGGEFACVQGGGQWDGPMDQASITAMLSWKINAVRVPLNEDCWLGINGANPGGVSYQSAVQSYVTLAINNGLYVILDLHWSAPGNTLATGQNPMPDADHSPAFWTSVANTFKNNGNVVFDLFNEPFPDSNQDTAAAWSCWKNGGTCSGVNYQVAGMQTLVNTVRATGANNLIMLGGVEYSNALTQWLANEPTDSANNLAASWHSYDFNICGNLDCWNNTIAGVMQHVPVITGELGENDCAHDYIDSLMSFLDSHSASYLAWTWNPWDCSSGPALITDYAGTPTNYGIGYKNHLIGLGSAPTSTPTHTPTVTPTNTPVLARINSIGVFRNGIFLLRLHNATGFADLSVAFNPGGKLYPVVGDWAGAGSDTIGVFNQNNGQFTLCTANDSATCASAANQIAFVLGAANDTPLGGKWANGATHFGAGVFRPSNGLLYFKNNLTSGFADYQMVLGIPGDTGLAGDWNGDGLDSPGVYRTSNQHFYLADQVCNCSPTANYNLQYGVSGDTPIVGDWVGQGHDGVGLFRQSNGFTYLRNSLTTGFANLTFTYGIAGDVPVAGHYQLVYPPRANPGSERALPTSAPVPNGGHLGD